MFFNILALAASLSIDSFGIGISYGMRKIKVPIYAIIIISMLAFIFSSLSIFLGTILLTLLPKSFAKFIGIIILASMGIWIIYQGISKKKDKKIINKKNPETILNLIIKSMGITIKIIRTPEYCDMDNSNIIEPKEAFYLGVALSVDSIGAGIGTAIMGINTLLIPIFVALFQLIFLISGIKIGKEASSFNSESNLWVIISGILLIIVAFIRLFF